MLELVRRAALVLLWLAVLLQTVFGELASARPAPRLTRSRAQARRPWGLEARRAGRVAGRLYAVRLQVVIV